MLNFFKKHFFPFAWLNTWRPYFLFFIICFIIYGRTLFFDFTYFDDSTLILEKIGILQDFKNISHLFSTDAFISVNKFYYRPLLNLSLMIDAQWAGSQAFFYHLTNIILHGLAASLFFYIINWLIKRRALALFLTLIFLVHPVLTQAVAWLPGRNDSLLTVFILGAFALFLNFCKRPNLWFYLGYLIFLFLALLSKESAVTLPLFIIYYFYFIDPKSLKKTDKYLLVFGSLTVGFIWFLMRRLALGSDSINYLEFGLGIINNSPALLLALGKFLFPFNLSVLPILIDSTIIYGLITLLILLVATILSKEKRASYLIFGLFWFLLFILPSFGHFNNLPDFLEHRLYLPFIGFLIFIAELDLIKNLDFKKRSVQIIVFFILLFFSVLTIYQSAAFSDRLTFWQTAVNNSPHSPLAQKNLGAMYYFEGNNEQSQKHYQLALELNPNEPMVHNNLGVIYLARQEKDRARQEFLRELEVNPGYDKALFNLGDLAERNKEISQAVKYYQAALSSNPYYREAYERLLILEKQLR